MEVAITVEAGFLVECNDLRRHVRPCQPRLAGVCLPRVGLLLELWDHEAVARYKLGNNTVGEFAIFSDCFPCKSCMRFVRTMLVCVCTSLGCVATVHEGESSS